MTKAQKTQWGDKEQRKQDILQAAQSLLESEGYAGLNIRSVAAKAQVSPGLVYAYFANKEELYATLYVERLVHFQQQIAHDSAQAQDIHQFFVLLLKAYLPVYQHFGREFNLFSLLRQPQQFPVELTEKLSRTAFKLIQNVYQYSQQFLTAEEVQVATLSNHELVLPMFWITLNGLADHFVGDRQHLYGHSLENMSNFISTTLLLGLKQQVLLSVSTLAQEQ